MTGFIIALISGSADESSRSFEYWGYEADQHMGICRLGAAYRIYHLCCHLVFFRKGKYFGILQVEPKYMLLGGIIGAFITYTVVRSMGSLGPAKAALIIVISQIIVVRNRTVWTVRCGKSRI